MLGHDAISAHPLSTIELVLVDAIAAIAPPGSTLTALQSGGGSWKQVVAIEGYEHRLSDASSAEVAVAWAGFDATSSLVGLTVDCENEQSISPWEPFGSGGRMTLTVLPDAADTFGIEWHRHPTNPVETILNASVGKGDVTISVLSTDGFAASGTVYVGTEAIGYTGKTATTFTGCSRGKYCPFGRDDGVANYVGGRWGQKHEILDDPYEIPIAAKVTQLPRAFLGKWIGLWLHRYDQQNGLLNTRENAQLVYPGRIVAVDDDPTTMGTVLHTEHLLDYVKRSVVGRDMWTARLKEGLYLVVGDEFTIRDSPDSSATWKTSNSLVVRVGAVGNNQIEEGIYTVSELHSKINTWLVSELVATRIHGTYQLGISTYGTSGQRTYFSYRIPGVGPEVRFVFSIPPRVSKFLGTLDDGPSTDIVGNVGLISTPGAEDDVDYDEVSDGPPLRSAEYYEKFAGSGHRFSIENERGTFVDQINNIPGWPSATLAGLSLGSGGSGQWGVFLIGDRMCIADKDGDTLRGVLPVRIAYAGSEYVGSVVDGILVERSIDDNTGPVLVKQVFVIDGTFGDVLKKIFYSTGTTGYNHAKYDVLGASIGIGIPGELLGQMFEDSIDALLGAGNSSTHIIDEPTKLEDLLRGSLIFRWAFLRWKNEHLQFSTWKTPITGSVLSESNKASPAGVEDNHRSASKLTDEWQKQYVKIDFDRDITNVERNGGFRSSITLVDSVAVDDAGGDARTVTLQLRDTYGVSGVELLRGRFTDIAPMFTRPVRKTTRSIDSRFFEGYAVGDVVLFTDEFARDPDTGVRGVTTRAAIITRHRWTLGGAIANSDEPAPVSGEVDLLLQDAIRVAPFCPSAQFDDTAPASGYVIATRVITCYAHKFSESADAADASYFTTGRAVRILQIDPADPAASSTHDDTVASQTGNTITLTTGFAAYNSSLRYTITFDTYGDIIANQQAFSFQADDTDGKVVDARVPFQYCAIDLNLPLSYTANSSSDPVSLPGNNTYGDGVAWDVGTGVQVQRLINNLLDYKLTHSMPYLQTAVNGAAVVMFGQINVAYTLVDIRPINLTLDGLSVAVGRVLSVAPFMRSGDGSSVTVRVSLVPRRPSSATINNVDRGAVYSQAVFASTSTTWGIATAQDLNIGRIKDINGNCYLIIECSGSATGVAECRGLGKCQEGPRQ